MSSSYRSSRLGLSHWDPYAMHRGGCLELFLQFLMLCVFTVCFILYVCSVVCVASVA